MHQKNDSLISDQDIAETEKGPPAIRHVDTDQVADKHMIGYRCHDLEFCITDTITCAQIVLVLLIVTILISSTVIVTIIDNKHASPPQPPPQPPTQPPTQPTVSPGFLDSVAYVHTLKRASEFDIST